MLKIALSGSFNFHHDLRKVFDEPEEQSREEADSLGRLFPSLKSKNVTHCELASETDIMITGSKTTTIFTEDFLLL